METRRHHHLRLSQQWESEHHFLRWRGGHSHRHVHMGCRRPEHGPHRCWRLLDPDLFRRWPPEKRNHRGHGEIRRVALRCLWPPPDSEIPVQFHHHRSGCDLRLQLLLPALQRRLFRDLGRPKLVSQCPEAILEKLLGLLRAA